MAYISGLNLEGEEHSPRAISPVSPSDSFPKHLKVSRFIPLWNENILEEEM